MILHQISDMGHSPTRIVSLVPSQTELLSYLGLDESIAGITKFCVHPGEWRNTKTIIGGTKNINQVLIKTLEPDLIIANKEENVREQVEALAEEFPVWLTDVNDLPGAIQMIRDIGRLTHRELAAETLAAAIMQEFATISTPPIPLPAAYLIWQRPYMTIGGDTFIHDMMQRCGLQNIFEQQNRYPVVTIEQIEDTPCRLLLLSSEPFPFRQEHVMELQQRLPGIKILLADGEMFSWYGSRLLNAPAYFKTLIKSFGF